MVVGLRPVRVWSVSCPALTAGSAESSSSARSVPLPPSSSSKALTRFSVLAPPVLAALPTRNTSLPPWPKTCVLLLMPSSTKLSLPSPPLSTSGVDGLLVLTVTVSANAAVLISSRSSAV